MRNGIITFPLLSTQPRLDVKENITVITPKRSLVVEEKKLKLRQHALAPTIQT